MTKPTTRRKKSPISLKRFAKRLDVTVSCVQLWARIGRLKTILYPIHNGRKEQHVTRRLAAKNLRAWRGSCSFAEGVRLLIHLSGETVTEPWLRKAVQPSDRCKVLGLPRLRRSSMSKLLDRWRECQVGIVHPDRIGFARLPYERIKELSARGSSKGGKESAERKMLEKVHRAFLAEKRHQARLLRKLKIHSDRLLEIERRRAQRRAEKEGVLRVAPKPKAGQVSKRRSQPSSVMTKKERLQLLREHDTNDVIRESVSVFFPSFDE